MAWVSPKDRLLPGADRRLSFLPAVPWGLPGAFVPMLAAWRLSERTNQPAGTSTAGRAGLPLPERFGRLRLFRIYIVDGLRKIAQAVA